MERREREFRLSRERSAAKTREKENNCAASVPLNATLCRVSRVSPHAIINEAIARLES